jgi:superfamily II DNA or RNA helicase
MPSVTLQELLRARFTSAIRKRGERYWRQGLVMIGAARPGRAEAVVLGSAPYLVTLEWEAEDRGSVRGSCTCLAAQEHGPCKHLWAVVLAVDDEGLARGTAHEQSPDDAALDDDYEEEQDRARPHAAGEILQFPGRGRAEEPWRRRLDELRRSGSIVRRDPWKALTADETELRYRIDVEESLGRGLLVVESLQRRRLKNGKWTEARSYMPEDGGAGQLDAADRRICAALLGAPEHARGYHAYYGRTSRSSLFALQPDLCGQLLPILCSTGRLDWWSNKGGGRGLQWDGGEPWAFELRVTRERDETLLSGLLARGSERMGLDVPILLLGHGFLFTRESVARFDPRGAMHHVVDLRRHGVLRVPTQAEDQLLASLIALPGRALTELPGIAWSQAAPPVPRLFIEGAGEGGHAGRRLDCQITFDYGGAIVEPEEPRETLLVPGRRLARRDFAAEARGLARFLALGGRRSRYAALEGQHGTIAARQLPEIVRALLAEGWRVEAEGRLWRTSSGSRASVRSGLDWFELEGGLEFGDQVAPFPALLAAARAGQNVVELGDGSFGIMPERWLERWGLLALAGEAEGERLRFARRQGWLLDALLAERTDVQADEGFARFRARLGRFQGVAPVREPQSFTGTLRPYQRDGLAWFEFLRELGLGGCLADDMGLGKTVQVLALLEARRLAREQGADVPRMPSLVVAPRSLVFNWIDEATRFAPRLRVLDFTGIERKRRQAELDECDLAVTTYGTLRRDIVELKERRFDYVVLDEATAIKNSASDSAKAVRLLQADQRLALSGTPIENHLGELWSLFEFLNPGMLGRSSAFKAFAGAQRSAQGAGPDLAELARALRPFFLRRTKEEVLVDLPAKTEQTLTCELGPEERKQYDELRDHYRAALLSREEQGGIERMKIQVLEALLRLRQCACHRGLIDPRLTGEDSAKLDMLLPRLEELAAEGHKALVFSQFTKLLAIVRARLDARGLRYQYLDGRTRDRKEKVAAFQSDPACPLFLVSLKAGGHGLNLTAADYVFLLDPWWNPAVESQAIDRAHRIGQELPVFAYRLIARGTVEEKVLELQSRKRELAATLLGTGSGVLSDLTREDLERLLS